MSIRSVTCPGCGAAANVPATMASARCPACGMVWNINQPNESKRSSAAGPPTQSTDNSTRSDSSAALALVGLIGGGIVLMALVGTMFVIFNRDAPPAAVVTTEAEPTIEPGEPASYRVVNLPEATRRRIYDDYRAAARTTTEKPLPLPQNSPARKLLEDTLQKTLDRELTHFAVLHNIEVDDVREIIKEGDANDWDPSPRSNAVRGGQRVSPPEMSDSGAASRSGDASESQE
jgi:predicted RNA-binding Zn-ribbon protein involved in translation (DUF1610 family)